MEDQLTILQEFLLIIQDSVIGYGPDILGAIITLIVGWMLAGFFKGLVTRALHRVPNMDETLVPMLSSMVKYAVLIVTFVAVLSQFGVETTSIIAVLGAAGLAIGLALQGTLQNIAAGIMLLMLRPFRKGDFIDASGIMGTVEAINLFTTDMKTVDGVYMAVPNSSLWNSNITNYSRNPTRRIQQVMGISYGDDVAKARGVLLELMEKDERVLADPAPQTMVSTLNSSSVDITMRCWVKTDDFWNVHFDILEKSKEVIEGAGMSIPFPQQDVHMHQVENK
ncbi:mechanosensitive ion channel family protein [Curvivirga sp.]|uniref:mechanosensitive ion channel family protein n=1 Tax=Curvivirga sp. TaxID=2856848 RepID=UPI003B59883E